MADELIQPGIFEGMTWWNSNNMSMNMMQMMNNPSKSSSCFLASPSPPAFCGDTNNILGYGGGGLGWSNHQEPIFANYSSRNSNKAVVSRSTTCYGGFYEDDDAANSTIAGGGNCYNPPLFASSDMGTCVSTNTIATVVAAPDASVQDWSPKDTLVSNTSSDQATNYYMSNNMDHHHQYPMLSKVEDIINDFGAVQDHRRHHQGLISISSSTSSSPSSSSSPPMNSSVNSECSTVTVDHNNPPAASTNLIQTLISCNEPTTNNQLQLFSNNNMGALNHHMDNYIGMINNNMPINEIPNSWNNFANSHDNSKSTAAAAALAASLENIRASLLFSPPSSPLPPQPQPLPSSPSPFASAAAPPNLQSSSAQFSSQRQAPNSNSEGSNNNSCATTARNHQILKENNKEKAAPTCNEPPLTKRPRIETPSPLPTFKVRKEKLGDRITALQQLVSPFGKTDTASVLHEAIEYIKFLHEQVNALSTSYMKNAAPIQNHHRQQGSPPENNHQEQVDLRSRGLCLVPISSTFPVAHETPADFWTPTFGTSFR